jgi:hypothetical protein
MAKKDKFPKPPKAPFRAAAGYTSPIGGLLHGGRKQGKARLRVGTATGQKMITIRK